MMKYNKKKKIFLTFPNMMAFFVNMFPDSNFWVIIIIIESNDFTRGFDSLNSAANPTRVSNEFGRSARRSARVG